VEVKLGRGVLLVLAVAVVFACVLVALHVYTEEAQRARAFVPKARARTLKAICEFYAKKGGTLAALEPEALRAGIPAIKGVTMLAKTLRLYSVDDDGGELLLGLEKKLTARFQQSQTGPSRVILICSGRRGFRKGMYVVAFLGLGSWKAYKADLPPVPGCTYREYGKGLPRMVIEYPGVARAYFRQLYPSLYGQLQRQQYRASAYHLTEEDQQGVKLPND